MVKEQRLLLPNYAWTVTVISMSFLFVPRVRFHKRKLFLSTCLYYIIYKLVFRVCVLIWNMVGEAKEIKYDTSWEVVG